MTPIRMCSGCMRRKPKNELIRIVRLPSGEIVIDESQKKDGRGVYICKNQKCLEIANRKKTIKRNLKADTDQSFTDYVKEYTTALE